MELLGIYELIKGANIHINKNIIYCDKYYSLPICTIRDNKVVLFFNTHAKKEVFRTLKILLVNKIDFLIIDEDFVSPKYKRLDKEYYHRANIKNYLIAYIRNFDDFNIIKFDLVGNLIKYTNEYDCFNLLKDEYEYLKSREINLASYDWLKNKTIPIYNKNVIESFNLMYRDIQLSKILL